jgi:hypothetical protein
VGVGVGVCAFVVVVVGERRKIQIGQANNAERDG